VADARTLRRDLKAAGWLGGGVRGGVGAAGGDGGGDDHGGGNDKQACEVAVVFDKGTVDALLLFEEVRSTTSGCFFFDVFFFFFFFFFFFTCVYLNTCLEVLRYCVCVPLLKLICSFCAPTPQPAPALEAYFNQVHRLLSPPHRPPPTPKIDAPRAATPTAIDPTPTAIDPTPTAIDPTPTAIDPTPTAIDPTPTASPAVTGAFLVVSCLRSVGGILNGSGAPRLLRHLNLCGGPGGGSSCDGDSFQATSPPSPSPSSSGRMGARWRLASHATLQSDIGACGGGGGGDGDGSESGERSYDVLLLVPVI